MSFKTSSGTIYVWQHFPTRLSPNFTNNMEFNVFRDRLYKDLIGLLESISRRTLNPTAKVNVLTEDIESYLDPTLYMGYAFETKVIEYRLEQNTVCNLRYRCIKFTLKLVQELQARLPLNFDILQKISMFSVEETLRVVKPSIVELAKYFRYNASEIDRLIVQWRNIVHVQWKCISSTLQFWSEVFEHRVINRRYQPIY